VFATQNLAAAIYCEHWIRSRALEGIVFFTVVPLNLCAINVFGVFVSGLRKFRRSQSLISKWYGIIETVGGGTKLVFVVASSLALYAIANQGIQCVHLIQLVLLTYGSRP